MKNKVVYVVLFVLLFSFIISNSIFASTVKNEGVTVDNVFYEFHDNMKTYSYYYLWEYNDDYWFIAFSNSPLKYNPDTFTITATNNSEFLFNNWSHSSAGLEPVSEDILSKSYYSMDFSSRYSGFDNSKFTSYYSNIDLYTLEGELFFQRPPQVGTLAPIVEEVETEKTLAEVIAILPLIIVVVVSFLGLRKALKMLSTVLRQS